MKSFLTAFTVFVSLISSIGPSHVGADASQSPVKTMQVTVLVPADLEKYNDLINENVFDAAANLPFVEKKLIVPYSQDVIRASADAAAKQMPNQGGPTIFYLKIIDRTAYVLLNIDRDGFAGVSYSIARSHPVIEKTLLQFKAVDHVVWNEAPADKRQYPD